MLNWILSYKYSLLLFIFIAVLSLIPSSGMPDSRIFEIPRFDKIGHFSIYTLLAFVALRENRCRNHCFLSHIILIFIVLIFSAMIEMLQATIIISRAAEWTDLIANLVGLLFGYLLVRLYYSLRS